MGAKAQVWMKETGVYLYTHHGGATIYEDVQNILDTQPALNRAEDPEYLTRIIFEGLVTKGFDKERGFGVGTLQHSDIEKLVTVEGGKITGYEEF